MVVNVIERAQRDTIQDLPDARKGETLFHWSAIVQRPYILPIWGTRDREIRLRAYDRHEYGSIWQGAVAGLTKRIAGTPFEITGPDEAKNEITYWQDVLRQANFGAGWSDFIEKGVRDYLRQDGGWYIELIAPGHPLGEPNTAVTGIAYLDSLRCYPTGDPNYPVIYWSRYNQMHLLNARRVVHLVDMPDGDESNPGYGLCALSRAIAIMTRQIHMGRYIEGRLDDLPPPGIVATNIPKNEIDAAKALFKAEQSNDEKPFWGRQIWLHHLKPDMKPEINPIAFAQAPEKFDYQTYMNIDINALALALGVDKQELWELSQGNLGTATQSELLAAKSRGKTFGHLLTQLERAINDILPEHLTFEFKYKDHQEETEKAQNVQLHTNAVQVVSGNLSQDEIRQYLANTSEAFAAVLLDPQGKLKPLEQAAPTETTATDATPLNAPGSEKPQDALPAPRQPLLPERVRSFWRNKDFHATRLEFVNNFVDLVNAGRNDELTRRRFGTVLRAQLRRLGAIAYRDGLRAGGVQDDLDTDDLLDLQVWAQQQSVYVTNFGAELFQKGLTPTQVYQRAEMWANKSLETAYQMGLASADKNGLYEWVLGHTEKHCTTCLILNGQRHRLRHYLRKELVPKSDKLECGGFMCDCKLVRTEGKSRGAFPRLKAVKGKYDESKHPRDEGGRFGDKPGVGNGEEPEDGEDKPAKPTEAPTADWAGKKRPYSDTPEGTDFGTFNWRDPKNAELEKQSLALSEQAVAEIPKQYHDSITEYSGGNYKSINGGLRNPPPSASDTRTIAQLDKAFDHAELDKGLTVYRGMNLSGDTLANIKPGATFKDKAFVSTSLSETSVDAFTGTKREGQPIIMRVSVPKGGKAIPMETLSSFTREHEVLLPRDSSFVITGVTKKKGVLYVDATTAA